MPPRQALCRIELISSRPKLLAIHVIQSDFLANRICKPDVNLSPPGTNESGRNLCHHQLYSCNGYCASGKFTNCDSLGISAALVCVNENLAPCVLAVITAIGFAALNLTK